MKHLDIRNMALIAVMTALVCIFGPMSILIDTVPFSLAPLLVYLVTYILGMWNGTIAYLVYLLISFVGVPVMSGYSDGSAKTLGPTGGYLMVFILMALMTGFTVEHFYRNISSQVVVMLVTLIIYYATGTVQFVGQTKMALSKAPAVCVYPFVPLDYIKLGLVIIIGHPVGGWLRSFLQARPAASLT